MRSVIAGVPQAVGRMGTWRGQLLGRVRSWDAMAVAWQAQQGGGEGRMPRRDLPSGLMGGGEVSPAQTIRGKACSALPPGCLPQPAAWCSQQRRGIFDGKDDGNLKTTWRQWFRHEFGDVTGRKKIGEDDLGNTYWELANPGRTPDPKREIIYAEKNMEEIEWHDVPPEWRLWCTHMREDPPSLDEVLKGRAKRNLILRKAAALEAEDKRMRSKQIAEGHLKFGDSAGDDPQGKHPIMELAERMNVGKERMEMEKGFKDGRPRAGGQQGGGQSAKKRGEEGTGSGESFVPGAWDPTKP